MMSYDDALATMDFRAGWEYDGIRHTDCQHAARVNFWRDILPAGLGEAMGREPGVRSVALRFQPGQALPVANPAAVYRVRRADVERRWVLGVEIEPRYGRFYPRGILRGVPGVFRENIQPFRCTELEPEWLAADFNHPLCGKDLAVDVSIQNLRPKFEEHGGTTIDWLETALTGPGMQARVNGRPTHFFADRPFARTDETEDGVFYERPRLVNHLDDAAIEVVSELYGRLIPAGAEVLDLMASWTSHLPEALALRSLTVLGLNRDELIANPRASERMVHDLNLQPVLPFGAGRFDAVVCTVSVEYLIRPFDVFDEVARVLRPGGRFILTFSNRWFPPKVIRAWPVLHEFERMGMVLEYFLKSGKYRELETYSVRGLPRPENDKYFGQMLYADPVYAVWGRKIPG
ncbi:MAG: class I SAM-dependent methyltransferase [Desulfobacterales bacterium]|jgi:SAM-dependent methyltransferase|nr:class I SAM-dependent methyltransferase [Desulfobacterales bacterium]